MTLILFIMIYVIQIREETQTKIDLPAEGEKSDVITITGKKENVEKAKEMIQKIQNELVICSIYNKCKSLRDFCEYINIYRTRLISLPKRSLFHQSFTILLLVPEVN